jgi:hypothetical protein
MIPLGVASGPTVNRQIPAASSFSADTCGTTAPPLTLAASTVLCLSYPFRYWNWKTASITATLRGSAFLLAAAGHRGGGKGALIEIAYVIFTSGFFSAIQQGFLGVRPRWAGRLGIVAGVPVAALALDCAVHLAAKSPNPHGFTAGMLVYSLISAAFHLHVMESGTMLVGQDGCSFASDLKAVPGLVVSFVRAPARWLAAAAAAPGTLPEAEWEAGVAE